MSNAKRVILLLLLAVGLILLIVGAATSAYSAMAGVFYFFICLFGSFAIGRKWAIDKYKAEQDSDSGV